MMAFQDIDDDGQGFVKKEELVKALNLCGLNPEEDAMRRVIHDVDPIDEDQFEMGEFVEFFKVIEEINGMERDAIRRASFFSCLCNVCFVLHVIAVALLTMMMVRMQDEKEGGGYQMIQSLLSMLFISFAILFVCVIGIPMLRLTLGVSIRSWKLHFRATLKKQRELRQRKREAAVAYATRKTDQNLAERTRNLRDAADGEDSDRDPDLPPTPEPSSSGKRRQSFLALKSMSKLSASDPPPPPGFSPVQKVLAKKDVWAYDPEAYRFAISQTQARMQVSGPSIMTFTQMQCVQQNLQREALATVPLGEVAIPQEMPVWQSKRGKEDRAKKDDE